LNRDISVSDILTELDLREGVTSSSQPRNDQFREPHIEEMSDMYDELLFDMFDIEDNENNELIDDLEEYRNDDNELIDNLEEYRDDNNELIDDREDNEVESEDEYLEDDDNLFAAPELEEEDESYEGVELEDKLDVEILLWLFKFQQSYRIPDTALEALIKFLNYTLNMIDNSKFCEFPASLFLAKRKLENF